MSCAQAVKSLTFNGIVIESRAGDNYINATQMCKAGCKLFADWSRLKATKELFEVLEVTMGIPIVKFIDSKEGKNGGSWVHPDLAVQLAQWISPSFAIQVSRWIRELYTCGTVSIDSRKTDEELWVLEQELFEKSRECELLQQTTQRLQQIEQETAEKLKQKDFDLAKARRKELKLEEFIRSTEKLPKNEVIYIAATTAYQSQNRYKVGGCCAEAKMESRLNSYNTGHAKNDPYYFVEHWLVNSHSEVEKIIKTKLTNYKDNRDRNDEMYHIHGSALMRALTFIIEHEDKSLEWFNQNFKEFTRETVEEDPVLFEPKEVLKKKRTIYATDGEYKVELADVTNWTEEEVQKEFQAILSTYKNQKNIQSLTGQVVEWKDLSKIIQERHKKARMTDWRDRARVFLPRCSERLRIKGLKL